MARAKRVCKRAGCPTLVDVGYCTECARRSDALRGRRQARGYTRDHERLRARWEPKVMVGTVHCHAAMCLMPIRLILPGMPWDLGHTEDRKGWTGPEHARCNRSAGGKAAH